MSDLTISLLLIAAGFIYMGLGALHALYAWRDRTDPRRFAPDDPVVLEGMQRATIRLTRGATTVWRGGLGFHFSHSMGAVLFGALAVLIGADHGHLALPGWVFPAFAVWSALYALVAWRYWFRIPQVGTAVATACLVAAVAVARFGAEPPEPVHKVVAGPTATPELTAAIEAEDRKLFDIVFSSCDLAALDAMLADDFEFLHDKWGRIAGSRAEFVDSIRGMCERRAAGTDVSARRELVAGTSEVLPLEKYGAIQQGSHRFYGLEPGKPDQLRETGRFFHTWRQVDGAWKLARVVSYDHRPAGPG